MGMDTQTGALRELLERELAPTEVAVSEQEAAVLARYKAQYRPELLRRWRAGDVVLRANGLLGEPRPVVTPRTREQKAIAESLDRYAAKKARQHRKALAVAARRKHGRSH